MARRLGVPSRNESLFCGRLGRNQSLRRGGGRSGTDPCSRVRAGGYLVRLRAGGTSLSAVSGTVGVWIVPSSWFPTAGVAVRKLESCRPGGAGAGAADWHCVGAQLTGLGKDPVVTIAWETAGSAGNGGKRSQRSRNGRSLARRGPREVRRDCARGGHGHRC